MKKTTVLMAAVLAVATVLAAGLTVLPSSVQEAQANPCSEIDQNNGGEDDLENEVDCDWENNGSYEVG
ncbi:MAG: hypothetical protein ACRD42_02095 [Nitrososphaeraceae archaeon]